MLVALVTGVLTIGTRPFPRLQQGLSVLGVLAYGGTVAALVADVFTVGATTYQLSGWTPPFGIVLVADQLSAFLLAMGAAVTVPTLVFSVAYVDAFGQRVSYHPLFHFMLVGVTGAFLTGDVFNLFVWFEVMLMPSYVLVVFYSEARHTRAALQYVVLNLIGSAVMLLAIGGLYATTGTLNMADMANRLANAAEFGIDPAPTVGLAALLIAVFALKAGIVPFQFWVPAAYRAAPAPVSAMLAGVTKKVGVYAIIRLLFTVFAAAQLDLGPFGEGSMLAFFGPLLFVMAAASILLGGYGAVGQPNLDDLLAYSSIGQVGFIVLPLAVAATVPDAAAGLQTLGIVAALIYSLNHALAKGLLFLVSGTIHESVGTIELPELGGLAGRRPVLSGAFLIGGLSLVGIPPLTGFFGKLLVFDTAGRAIAGGALIGTAAIAVGLAGAILTIAYVSGAWGRAFWSARSDTVAAADRPMVLIAVGAGLAVTVLVVGIGLDPVYAAADAAAEAALDWEGYHETVDPKTLSEVTEK